MEKEWFKVENLEKMQEEALEKYSRGEIDNRGDFHSYRLLNEGKDYAEANIANHNIPMRFVDVTADLIYEELKRYGKKYSIPICRGTLGDFGGGGRLSCKRDETVFSDGLFL